MNTTSDVQFLKEDCENLLRNTLKSEKFKIINFFIQPWDEKCGYFGDHFKICIEINFNDSIQKLNYFAKFIPGPKSGIDYNLSLGAFKKEIFIYEDLFKIFRNSGIHCIQNAVPECFYTKPGCLVFEDLRRKGFQTIPRYTYINYEHVEIIIKTLAKIHASGLVYEQKEKCSLEDYFSKYDETFYSKKKGHKGTKSLYAALKGIYTEIDIFNFSSSKMTTEEFKKKAEIACHKMLDLVKPSQHFQNVICHGDLWQTNFMMNYGRGQPIECIIIDFQTARYTPPALDVMAFLYLTTSRKFRQEHFKDIINLYYNELRNNMAQHGYNLTISYNELIDSCEEYKIFAAVQSATYFQLTHVKSESIAELAKDYELWERALYEDHSILILQNYQRDPNYKNRLEESLTDLCEACENINI